MNTSLMAGQTVGPRGEKKSVREQVITRDRDEGQAGKIRRRKKGKRKANKKDEVYRMRINKDIKKEGLANHLNILTNEDMREQNLLNANLHLQELTYIIRLGILTAM